MEFLPCLPGCALLNRKIGRQSLPRPTTALQRTARSCAAATHDHSIWWRWRRSPRLSAPCVKPRRSRGWRPPTAGTSLLMVDVASPGAPLQRRPNLARPTPPRGDVEHWLPPSARNSTIQTIYEMALRCAIAAVIPWPRCRPIPPHSSVYWETPSPIETIMERSAARRAIGPDWCKPVMPRQMRAW